MPSLITRFCVLTTERSGSTWLVSTLDQAPEAAVYGELFRAPKSVRSNQYNWLHENTPMFFHDHSPSGGIRRSLRLWPYLKYVEGFRRGERFVGYKVMAHQIVRMAPLLPIAWIVRGYKIILLERDTFEISVSRFYRTVTGISHSRSQISTQPVSIDPAWLISDMKRIRRRQWAIRMLYKCLPARKISVRYEALRHPSGREWERIYDFLGIESGKRGSGSTTAKLIKDDYAKVIANYDQIVSALARAGFTAPANAI